MKEKTLYKITMEDVINVSEDTNIPFTKKDLPFIQDKIGDFLGDKWYDAVEFALYELKDSKKKLKIK